MIYRLILIYFLIFTSNSFGQTIQELEYDLSWYSSSEKYGDKIEKAKRLQEIDPFNFKATEYICRYYDDRKIDSVSIYFDNLIIKFPDKTEPYLLRSELLFFELEYYKDKDEYNKRRVKILKQALEINPKDPIIVFKLAEAYYEDFIFPLEKKKDWGLIFDFGDELIDTISAVKDKPVKKSTFEHAADSSLIYFYQAWDLRKEKRDIIYYPIRQLECFLDQRDQSPIPSDSQRDFDQCYFPSNYFTNLTNNWECDFSINYLFEIESGKSNAKWLQVQLRDLKEDCLYNKELQQSSIIYRFTWLRSFNHPIAIRIEKVQNEIMLYWKVGKGESGYEPKGLKKSGKKKLSLEKWIAFEEIVKASNFDSLPNEDYMPMTDGATWTLERKKYKSFKAHRSNWPSEEFSKACLYLLDLTNIRVKDN